MTGANAPTTTPPLSRRHLPALDGIRGLAILVVLLHHFTPAATGGTATTRWLLTVLHSGWVGVDLFFVLSGFLITGILLDTRHRPGYFRDFFARRALRIMPLYFGTLAVLFGVLPLLAWIGMRSETLGWLFSKTTNELHDLQSRQHWLWLYLTNVRIGLDQQRLGVVNHFWSLAVEEHFYLFWPLVVWALSPRRLLWACLGCIVIAPVFRATLWISGFDPVVSYVLTPCRVDSLAFGGLGALLLRSASLARLLPRLMLQMGAGATVLLLAMVLGYGRFDRDDPLVTILGFSLLAAAFMSLTVSAALVPAQSCETRSRLTRLSLARSRLTRLLSAGWLMSLGRYSYGIYVLHHFLTEPMRRLLPWNLLTQVTGSYLAAIVLHALAGLVVSYIVAWVVYHAFERRFLRLKRHFESPSDASLTEPLTLPVGDSELLPAPRPAVARAA